MDYQDSFKYVFYDLLQVIEPVKIEYQHRALICTYEDGITPNGTSQWSLSVVSFSNSKTLKGFKDEFSSAIDSTINQIHNSRIELTNFLEGFIEELDNKQIVFRELINNTITLKDLVKNNDVLPVYKGYMPIEDHNELHVLGIKEEPQKAEYGEKDYDKLFRLTKLYFNAIDRELARLALFLRHEKNINLVQNERISSQTGKEKYLYLIRKGDIDELFDKLHRIDEYKNNEQIIQLSARYYLLEKDKRLDSIKRDDYNIQLAKIITSIIAILWSD